MSNNGVSGGETSADLNIVPGSGSIQDRSPSERTTSGLPFTFEDVPSGQRPVSPPMPPHELPLGSSLNNAPPEPAPDPGLATCENVIRPIPLEGVVTLVQRTEEEPPPNWYRTLSKGIMTIILLPIFITFGLASLVLSIAFAIIGFQALSSIFNPVSWMTAIFEFMEVFVLGRLQRSSQHTVYRGLVRDAGDRVFAFYLHGVLRSGILVEGHRVRLFGEWRRSNRRGEPELGTLFVSRGEDLATGSSITSGPNVWRPVFFVLLAIFLGVIAYGVVHAPQFMQRGSTLSNSIRR